MPETSREGNIVNETREYDREWDRIILKALEKRKKKN